jgi:hypothetical protein
LYCKTTARQWFLSYRIVKKLFFNLEKNCFFKNVANERYSSKTVKGNSFLQSFGSFKTNQVELGQLLFDTACFEIDICKRIQFVENDVNIVSPNSGGEHRNHCGSINTCNRCKLSVADRKFYVVKISKNHRHAVRVSN